MEQQSQTRKSAPDLEATIHSLLECQVQCVLATMFDNRPYQHLMAYAFDVSLQSIYVASLRDTEKVENMLRVPAVSLFWDNRTGSIQDHTEGLALTASGHAELLDTEERSSANHALLARNSTLANLLNNVDVAIFAIRVSRYSLALGYTSKQEYLPGYRSYDQ
ncbi:MAG: pyridoxamine 5'-phosphate oxidase family protein [Pseudomonadales bacterium]